MTLNVMYQCTYSRYLPVLNYFISESGSHNHGESKMPDFPHLNYMSMNALNLPVALVPQEGSM